MGLNGRVYLNRWGEIIIDFPKDDRKNKDLARRVSEIFEKTGERIVFSFSYEGSRGWMLWPSKAARRLAVDFANELNLSIDSQLNHSIDEIIARFKHARFISSYATTVSGERPQLSGYSVQLNDSQLAGFMYALHAQNCIIGEEAGNKVMEMVLAAIWELGRGDQTNSPGRNWAFPLLIVTPHSDQEDWKRVIGCALPQLGDPFVLKPDHQLDQILNSKILIVHQDIVARCYPALSQANLRSLIVYDTHEMRDDRTVRTTAVLQLSQLSTMRYRFVLTHKPIDKSTRDLLVPLKIIGRLGDFTEGDNRSVKKDSDYLFVTDEKSFKKELRSNCLLWRTPEEQDRVCFESFGQPHRVEITNREDYNRLDKIYNEQESARKRKIKLSSIEKRVSVNDLRLAVARGKLQDLYMIIELALKTHEKILIVAERLVIMKLIAQNTGGLLLNSRVKGKKRDEVLKQFREDPTCRVLVVGVRIERKEIDLTMVDRVVFAELSWTPSGYEVIEKMLVPKDGTRKKICCDYLYADNTIDEGTLSLVEDRVTLIRLFEEEQQ